MSGAATLTPQAQRDLRAALRWIGRENAAAARNLRDAVAAAAALIGARPEAGRHRLDLASQRYRFWSLPAFSYLVVYDTARMPPRIARIVHTARDLPKALADLDS